MNIILLISQIDIAFKWTKHLISVSFKHKNTPSHKSCSTIYATIYYQLNCRCHSHSRAENYNTSAVEFLRRLPGVTDSNYRAIMDACKSLAELSLLPVEKLAVLMGGQQAARTLRDFLDAKYPTLLWVIDWDLFILQSSTFQCNFKVVKERGFI